MVEGYNVSGISPEYRLREVNEHIRKTNGYLMGWGEKPVRDPKAIEIVRDMIKYSRKKGIPIEPGGSIIPEKDMDEITKLLARGQEKDLTYEETVKEAIDYEAMPQNYNEALQKTGYFFNSFENDGKPDTLDPYQNVKNVDLDRFFNLPTKEKADYLNKIKNLAKKAGRFAKEYGPAAIMGCLIVGAASAVIGNGVSVVSAQDNSCSSGDSDTNYVCRGDFRCEVIDICRCNPNTGGCWWTSVNGRCTPCDPDGICYNNIHPEEKDLGKVLGADKKPEMRNIGSYAPPSRIRGPVDTSKVIRGHPPRHP